MSTQLTTKLNSLTHAFAKPTETPDYPFDRVSTSPNLPLEKVSEILPANAQDFATALAWLKATGCQILTSNPRRITYRMA